MHIFFFYKKKFYLTTYKKNSYTGRIKTDQLAAQYEYLQEKVQSRHGSDTSEVTVSQSGFLRGRRL